jgi:hypothetical protein
MADEKKELQNVWETLGIQYLKGHKGKVVVKAVIDKDTVSAGSKVYTGKDGKEFLPVYVTMAVMVTDYVDYRGGKNKGVRARIFEVPEQVREEINKVAEKVRGMFVSDFTTTKDGKPLRAIQVRLAFNLPKEEVEKATPEGLARRAVGLARSKVEREIIPAFRETVANKGKSNNDIDGVVEEINDDGR